MGIVKRVSAVNLCLNIAIAGIKLVAGLMYASVSVMSDAVHGLADIGASLLLLVVACVMHRARATGCEARVKFLEPVAVLVYSLILLATGIMLLYDAILGLISPSAFGFSPYLIGVAVGSVVVKELMYRYTARRARQASADTLFADAWHHRSDALVSLAVLVGLAVGAVTGVNVAENVAVVVVAVLIFKVAFEMIIRTVRKLTQN